jgi:transposase
MRKSRSMKRKRKQYSGAFKAKVGLEAMIGIKTTAQLAREYQVHPLLVTQWKKIIRDRMPELFERGRPVADEGEKIIAQLHQKIGQLTVDLDWLKKKCRQLGLSLNDEH